MISLDVKPESKASSPIGLSVTKESTEEPTVSFSQLLHGAKSDKKVQNGSFVLALDVQEDTKLTGKKDTLLGLLKNDTKLVGEDSLKNDLDALQLNPKVTQNLSVAEIKILIADAKQFLKNKILQSDDFKMAQVKDLPKTLKGLSDMAKSFGIDMSKITLEEVKLAPKALSIGSTVKTDDSSDEKLHAGEAIDIKTKPSKNKVLQAQSNQEIIEEIKVKDTLKEDVKVNDKKIDILKDVKATPLFKATEKTELTTEQLVQTKQFKVEDKTSKTKADETLKLLLRGDKPSNLGINMTSDFSVATARVIAPSATSEVSKSLEQLLHGAPDEATSKTDGLSTHKSDSFEVKLNEAKQMIKYLSGDVKTAIEDYKSPFTRVKVQLNPAKMGDVDITIVSRGKNLHVNISSNTAAINTLAINANELRTQLSTNGIQNASLNFNNSEQNTNQHASQQQHNKENEKKADEEYSYFDNEEHNEEVLSSLEIVVPNYA